jgi:hypothetical protein
MPTTATTPRLRVAAATLRQRLLAAFEQGALVEQVLAAVGRQAQLGKGDDDGALPGRLLEHGDRLGGVERGIGDAHARHRDRDANEAMGERVQKGE